MTFPLDFINKGESNFRGVHDSREVGGGGGGDGGGGGGGRGEGDGGSSGGGGGGTQHQGNSSGNISTNC